MLILLCNIKGFYFSISYPHQTSRPEVSNFYHCFMSEFAYLFLRLANV